MARRWVCEWHWWILIGSQQSSLKMEMPTKRDSVPDGIPSESIGNTQRRNTGSHCALHLRLQLHATSTQKVYPILPASLLTEAHWTISISPARGLTRYNCNSLPTTPVTLSCIRSSSRTFA